LRGWGGIPAYADEGQWNISFRGKDLDIRKVAEMLDVRTILEGNVRRSGNRIRVSVQLINAMNGYHIWSERYDREMADVFVIQDEIAQAIASVFRQVLEIDESFWLALTLDSLWHSIEGNLEVGLSLAERAYAVAPANAGSIGVLAGLLWRLGNTERAKQLEQELGDGTAYGAPLGFLIFEMARGQFDRLADWAEKAIAQRDPNILPVTSLPTRAYLIASGRWPNLKQLLRL
jgi:hypothetical protein